MPGPARRFFFPLLAGAAAAAFAAPAPPARSLPALEQRLQEIDARLAGLANYNPSGGVGPIGSRSRGHENPGVPEWMEIDLGDEVALDQIVLVPAIRRDRASGFQADGFPVAFQLRAGTRGDRTGRVVAGFTARDGLLPRVAPVVIPCPGLTAAWIRVEASQLSPRAYDGRFVLQFSEILAFRGEENLALLRPVRYPPSHEASTAPGWPDHAVVDGFVPYLMAAAQGESSVAYLRTLGEGPPPTLTIDLGADYPLSRLHLHAVDQSDTVPQAFAGDIGMPRLLRLEGARQPDFSDARTLLEWRHETIYDVGPILTRRFAESVCRYVRLVALQAADNPFSRTGARLGFAEIELFSGGRNVALHRPVTASFGADDPIRPLARLTDGRNFYGQILPLRAWLNELALRHELERERPVVSAELNQRYVAQKANVTRLSGLAVLLAAGVVALILVNRTRRQRAIEETRKRIAADLHDELGADLHAIGLLSDLALGARATPERLGDLLQRMRALTVRTGQAARHCTDLLEAGGLHADLVSDLRHAASRILADLEHQLDVEAPNPVTKLAPRTRMDLLLFYQECLINIIRHSGATRAHTRLATADGQVCLTVTDNGRGLDGKVPASLRRRARLLGARLEAGPATPRGTRITLRLRRRWFGLLP